MTFVLSLSSLASSTLYYLVLMPLGLGFLKLLSFIFIIATLVQFTELVMQRFAPALHRLLGIYLPLITTSCAVLGVALWNIDTDRYTIAQSTVAGFASGLGFTLVLVLMAGIRRRMQLERVPRFLRGTPIALISAGLMALGFYAFDWSLFTNLGLR